jgi:hypothetical protein
MCIFVFLIFQDVKRETPLHCNWSRILTCFSAEIIIHCCSLASTSLVPAA